MRQKTNLHTPALIDRTTIKVRFSEIDSMQIVWHGEYVRYFEDGRESFGLHYPGIGYQDMQTAGIYAALYDFHVRYYAPLCINDTAVVHTRYIYKRGARIDFRYKIYRERDNVLCAEVQKNLHDSVQLFTDPDGNLLSLKPDFYATWQDKFVFMTVHQD